MITSHLIRLQKHKHIANMFYQRPYIRFMSLVLHLEANSPDQNHMSFVLSLRRPKLTFSILICKQLSQMKQRWRRCLQKNQIWTYEVDSPWVGANRESKRDSCVNMWTTPIESSFWYTYPSLLRWKLPRVQYFI
jgi:hypothetical protein